MCTENRSTPPKCATIPSPAFLVVVMLAVAMLGSGLVLFFFDPTKYGFYPLCLFHALTGWYCPGCGGTRAAYELLHGHLVRALHDNALVVLALAAVLIWNARWLAQRLRGGSMNLKVPVGVWWTLLVVALVFTVLRNLSAFAWLAP